VDHRTLPRNHTNPAFHPNLQLINLRKQAFSKNFLCQKWP
jgi:hypothetical protein